MIIINKLKNSEVYLFFRRKRQKKMKKVRKLSLNFFFFLKRFKMHCPNTNLRRLRFFFGAHVKCHNHFFFLLSATKPKRNKPNKASEIEKKTLCVEEKLKRLRTKVKTHKINFNSNFFFFNNSFFFALNTNKLLASWI